MTEVPIKRADANPDLIRRLDTNSRDVEMSLRSPREMGVCKNGGASRIFQVAMSMVKMMIKHDQTCDFWGSLTSNLGLETDLPAGYLTEPWKNIIFNR